MEEEINKQNQEEGGAGDQNEEYSPYCKLCTSCGEDGCCSHISCIRTLVEKNKDCAYGQTYLKEVLCNKRVAELSFEIFEKIKKGEIDLKNALEEFDKRVDEIFDEIY